MIKENRETLIYKKIFRGSSRCGGMRNGTGSVMWVGI